MTAPQALKEIRGLASANRIRLTQHARERMAERGATYGDVRNALANATTCTADKEAGKWRVKGVDLDGDALTCIVTLDGAVVVITLF